jgi:hypothetical protein
VQYDVGLLQEIERAVAQPLALMDVKEEVVLPLLSTVATARRVASMRLVEIGFTEKAEASPQLGACPLAHARRACSRCAPNSIMPRQQIKARRVVHRERVQQFVDLPGTAPAAATPAHRDAATKSGSGAGAAAGGAGAKKHEAPSSSKKRRRA